MDSKIIKLILFIIFFSTEVLSIEFSGKFIQGHFIIGKTNTGSKVYIDQKEVKVSKDGFFAFGLDRDRKFDVIIESKKDGINEKIIKKVKKRKNILKKF